MAAQKWKVPATVGIAFVFAIILTMNTFNFMLLFWSFFAGISAAVFVLKPGYELPNLLSAKFKTVTSGKPDAKIRTSCSVCGIENCTRERSDSSFETLQPWIGVEVNERVDKAITEFLELLLQNYVWNWYRNLSEDEAFVFELKVALRHCLAVLYRRINKVDISEVIIKKLLRLAMIHLHICLSAMKAGCNTEEEILLWYGSNVHTALKSRRDELNYIRALCDCIFPHLCPPSLVQSKVGRSFLRELLASNVILYGIDIIDDPDKVNHLLLLFFDKDPPREADEPPSPMVPLLEKFAAKDYKSSNSLLFIDLPKIMTTQGNQDMLYQFMSFLKTVNAVHHLQFCLTVDDFNRRCLSQDQTEAQQIKLHQEAKEIYKTYCCPDSPTFIHFDEDIITDLGDVANGHPCEVNRLRTSAPLFRAYDHVYNLLERIYCPLFYQSDMYYKMICGDRRFVKAKKPPTRQNTFSAWDKNDSARSSLRRKKETKDASKMNNSSDSVDIEQDVNLIDDDVKSAQLLMEDEVQDDFLINRDLSTWRIEIPKIEIMKKEDLPARSANSSERIYAFYVEVKRVDIQEDDDELDHWSILRRYSEFYVLENKLTEFHGSLGIISLPQRKILGRTFDFLDSKRSDFEKFLRALISQPRLRHSELLFDFLSLDRSGAGSKFATKLLPDVKLGRIFRRVPTKLLKEKGQHLSLFLNSFIQSCEPPKPKPGKYEPITDNPEIQMDQKLHHDLYPEGDWVDSFQSAEQTERKESIPFFNGVCDYLIFIGVEVFQADAWLHHIMVGVKKLFRPTVEPYAYNYLKAKIDRYRQEHHVVDLIHIFRDILFHSNNEPRTDAEKLERKEEAYQAWEEFIPTAFAYMIGSDRHQEGCKKMFEILQKPKLNKQLGYLLLDCVLVELFPELNVSSRNGVE